MKVKGSVDDSTVTRLFKIFHGGYKKFDYQAKSDKPKNVDFEALFQAAGSNLASNI